MKLSFIFILFAFIQVAATGYSQSINLDVSNMEIRQVIKNIEQQSEYRFFYTDGLTDLSRKVDMKLTEQPIEDVLLALFDNTQLGYQLVDNKLIILAPKGILQQITITGTVTDAAGEPLPGVSIMIKGSQQGTATDTDGAFSLQVPNENTILVFSYIGFTTQEIIVGNRRTISVVLIDDTRQLEEVVVVGYGTQKKVNLTGSVSQIKGDVLENRPVQRLSQALQGQVANLNVTQSSGRPGTTLSLNIRGYTGFDETGSPLIVVDGIQGVDINTINMTDVENISVLKDAASVAIYGSSAPYGVIIINTKKGAREKKPTITYNANFGQSKIINMPKMMNSLDFANIMNESADNANVTRPFTDENLQRIRDYLDGKITTETIPRPGYDEWQTFEGNANNQWFDILFKPSFSQQHAIGVSGGSANSSYYVGLGYNQKDGMFRYGGDIFQQYNVRTNLSTDLTKWLTFNFRGMYQRSSDERPSTESWFGQIVRYWPTNPLYCPNGELDGQSLIPHLIQGGRYKSDTDQTTLTGEFVVHPLPGWDITANYTFDGTFIATSTHYATIYQSTPSGATSIKANATNSFGRTQNTNQHHVGNMFSSYEKQLGNHYFKLLLGYTQELYDYMSLSASNTYLYSDALPAISLTYNPTRSASDGASQLASRGWFGRINYNYQEKYLIELNGRYDGTSRFMKEVRYKFYPGVSAAWVPSKENFWEPIQTYINMLKFRVSYGQLGDQGFTGYYPFYPSLSTVAATSSNWMFSSGRQSYVSSPPLTNPSLTWVTSTTLDFGFDLAFLNSRLNVNFDWYKRSADDFVGPTDPLPVLLGVGVPQSNNSSIVTKGIEITLGWNDRILNNQLHYGVNFVLGDYRGEVVRYPNPTMLNTTWYNGRQLGEIWGYETYGLFQSDSEVASAPSQERINGSVWTAGDCRYVDQNGDGIIDWGSNTVDNPGDRKIIGNNTPRYSYGLTLNADYKGFDFSIFTQGVGKRDAWITGNFLWGITGHAYDCALYTIHYDRWTTDNPNGYFPKYYRSEQIMAKNMQVQSRYLQNAAYMRIKNMQIGYSLPVSLIEKIKFQRVRIYISAENFVTFTKMLKTVDPEFAHISAGAAYPLQGTWSFGLNVTF